MAKYEAMKVVQRQLHLQYLATKKPGLILEGILVNGIDVAWPLKEGMPHGRIVDKIAPHLESQPRTEPERRVQSSYDEDELMRRLTEFLNAYSLAYGICMETGRKLRCEQCFVRFMDAILCFAFIFASF